MSGRGAWQNRLRWACGLALAVLAGATQAADAPKDEIIDHGRFHGLHLLKPDGPARSTVLLLSSSRGWDAEAQAYAETLRRNQTLVAGIDTPAMIKVLAEDGDDCEFLDGDLDNLGRFVQAYTHQDDFRHPLLFGIGDGAALTFGVLAQSPVKTFAGGVGVGFCPHTALHPPLCQGSSLQQRNDAGGSQYLPTSRLLNPFTAVITPASAECGAVEFLRQIPNTEMTWPIRRTLGPPSAEAAAVMAYSNMASDSAPATRKPDALPDLPLIEVPRTVNNPQYPDVFAVLMSGDGGWAGLDEEVADALAAKGIPVVGMDSLRYFWSERTPENVATDIGRLIEHYAEAWERPRVLLIGYSQGADVLPFAMNLFTPATREHLAMQAAVALSEHAAFEFHVGAWAGQDSGGMDTMPELDKLKHRQQDFMIVCGKDDDEAICPKLDARDFHLVILPGSHHFDGNYEQLAQTLIDALPAQPPAKP